MRLPIVALLDVVLFFLLYFIVAGSLAPLEGELAATLSTDRKGGGAGSSALTAQVLRIEPAEGGARYRMGDRVMGTRDELLAVLRALPKEPGVVIKSADDVAVRWAATAVQCAKDAGFTKVSYVASW